MASAFITRRPRRDGTTSYRVYFKLGGRESANQYAGSFRTMREAKARRAWVAGELAQLRVPDVSTFEADVPAAPLLRDVAAEWRATRIDVTESTRVLHRVALDRALGVLGDSPVDQITPDDVVRMVRTLSEDGKKRETIRKSVMYLAAVLDYCGAEPNPAKSERVRLPHEEQAEINPPTAQHVATVCELLPRAYRLPLLWLDWSGARVASIDLLTVGDYDEQERRVRLRASTTKTRAALWVDLPDVLADALEASLPPREDRDGAARLFPDCTADRLRTAIGRSCRASGIPVFSPHDLRHRRISLLHRQGKTWAEIGRMVGQKKLSITADTYTHVLIDSTEADYRALVTG